MSSGHCTALPAAQLSLAAFNLGVQASTRALLHHLLSAVIDCCPSHGLVRLWPSLTLLIHNRQPELSSSQCTDSCSPQPVSSESAGPGQHQDTTSACCCQHLFTAAHCTAWSARGPA